MDSEIPKELDRLITENRALVLRLRRMAARQESFEWRLQRIENSAIFRSLRWLGPKLAALGLPIPGIAQGDRVDGDAYQTWIKETALLNHVEHYVATHEPAISVILDAGASLTDADRVAYERAIASLRAQKYKAWDLIVRAAADAPSWVDTVVQEAVPLARRVDSIASALQSAQGEAILWTNPNVILEPNALRTFAGAFDEHTVAVYSDWDHIDSNGRRHSPRFTPELSPELLRQNLYWGECFLTAAAPLREMPWPETAHELAIQLARRPGSIHRVPSMLWHSQEPGATPSQVPEQLAPSTARASIIICSRNPERLGQCLKALRPTVDPRHEIIVVAHEVDLSAVARQYNARVTCYDGPFHFGVMNAQGVRESTGDVLCFLNDDVFPSTPDWLERMLVHFARPEVAIVGALLLYPDGAIQHAGVVVDRWNPTHIGRFQRESAYWPWLRFTREVSAVTGACMLVRRSAWDEVGGFDLLFPVNYNDIDLCLRAGARGYRIVLETRAVLVHEESRTRVAVVRPEEIERFQGRWFAVSDRPDPYFNPQLSTGDESIALPAPWTAIR